MNELLKFVGTPTGQQVQFPFIPTQRSEKITAYVGVSSHFLPGGVMGVPHHGQIESETFSTFSQYYGGSEIEPAVQFNLTSDISNFGYLSERLKHSKDAIRNTVQMDLNIMHGNPVFHGTRIPVYQIIEELADGTSMPDILEGYPSLTLEQIQRGLDFAASVVRIYE